LKITIDILLALLCLVILAQDLRSRLISVILLVLVGILLGAEFVLYNQFENTRVLLLGNYLFITAQLGLLYFYFTRVRKTRLSFFDQVLGWGDVVMILCMALAFPLPQLVLYFMVSYLAGMAFALFYRLKKTAVSIPLAGIMGLVYVLNLAFFYCTGFSPLELFAA